MRYTVRRSVVSVVGKIWMPSVTCAMDYTIPARDLDEMERPITRDVVADWLGTHSGDFASITDFWASIEDGENTIEIPWEHEESQFTYSDCMFPAEQEG